MSQRVFLHVGLPKSGTTYIQAVLGKNKSLLKERAGLLYPGKTWNDQVDAVRDIRRMHASPSQRLSVNGAWARMAGEMKRWHGDSVFSMEWLCRASPEQLERVVNDLDFADVHAVFTVRDVARTVPAAWQEFCQNRATWRWPDFLEQVTADDAMDTPAGKAIWGEQDMELLLDRWSAVVPAGRTHVVTLPQSGADPAELWRRMAHVLGVEPTGYDLTDLGANASLGLESAELMRRVNELVEDLELPVPTYNRVFKQRVAKTILARRKGQESKLVLPERYHDWAHARAEQQIAAIEKSGAEVVGDLAELRPALPSAQVPEAPSEPPADAVLEAAVEALVAVAVPKRRRRPAQGAGQDSLAHDGWVRRIRADWADRLRGRSGKELAAAAARRLRRSSGTDH